MRRIPTIPHPEMVLRGLISFGLPVPWRLSEVCDGIGNPLPRRFYIFRRISLWKQKKRLRNIMMDMTRMSALFRKHGMMEYLTTMKYIETYLRPNVRILEIGAATGRYSHALAQRGYRVDAVELLEHNIELFQKNTVAGEPVTITQGNALDLSAFESNT